MSSVFEIQSTAMGFREVAALKIVTVQKNFRGEVKIPENALNEIKILRDLSGCPNIVHYHDSTQRQIFDDEGNLSEIDILIKMEKLKSLRDDEKLSEEKVIRLAKNMCTALIHANEHGIIHRDIKPQNIFVDDDGNYKLGDFGIAKIVSDFCDLYTMNIGTLAYSAPEIRSATMRVYDIASDIYSLGLVLYVFLNNGQLPFANVSSTLNEAIARRLSGAAFPSPARGSKNLKSIVMRACNADLAKRYKTPEQMLEDLELLSTGGKKMVVDPFATLDANIDAMEIEEYLGGSRIVSTSPGAPVSPVHSEPMVATPPKRGGLKINLGGKSSISAPSTPTPAVHEAEVSSTRVASSEMKSRLKINMGSSASVRKPEVSSVDESATRYIPAPSSSPMTTIPPTPSHKTTTPPTPSPRTTATPDTVPVTEAEAVPTPPPSTTGSRLKINMGGKKMVDSSGDTEKKTD